MHDHQGQIMSFASPTQQLTSTSQRRLPRPSLLLLPHPLSLPRPLRNPLRLSNSPLPLLQIHPPHLPPLSLRLELLLPAVRSSTTPLLC